MKYRYKGVTRNRETVSGLVEATNLNDAKRRLREMEVRALEVYKDPFSTQFNLSIGSAVNLKGLIIFTRQLSSLINSGVTIVMALQILSEQERRPEFKKILVDVKNQIESGGGFAEALSKYPKTFSEFYIRVIEAGELSGTMDKALIRVGQQLEKLNNIRRKVISAMLYPAITLVVAIGVTGFLLAKVVPEIVSMYPDKNKLPAITLTVIRISEMVQEHYLAFFVTLVVSVIGAKIAYGIPVIKLLVDPILLKVPVFGLLILRSSIAILTRTLSTLVSSGVQLLAAFQICERVSSNTVIKGCIRDAANSVTEGQSIAKGLAKRNVMPAMVLHMVNIGEMTGKLDELLMKVAEIYDEEVDDAVNLMTSLLQPILILLVGGIILTIMVAIYMPLFNISEAMAN